MIIPGVAISILEIVGAGTVADFATVAQSGFNPAKSSYRKACVSYMCYAAKVVAETIKTHPWRFMRMINYAA